MRYEHSLWITPGGALLLGGLILLLHGEELLALLSAAAVHELGHVAALYACGTPPEGMTLSATGPVLHCELPDSGAAAVVVSLSGPFAGMLFWLLFVPAWPLSSEISLVLSAVNLLPVLPLDGGRALRALLGNGNVGKRIMTVTRFAVILCMSLIGLYCLCTKKGAGLLLFSVWLLLTPDPASHL